VKRVIDKVSGALMAVEKIVMLSALAGMLLTMLVAIAARPLGANVPWVNPLALALMIVATFTGAALATAMRRHISMDLLSKVLKLRMRAVVSLVTSLLGASLGFVLARAGVAWVMAMDSDVQISATVSIPEWWLQAMAPVGLGLCAVHFLLNAAIDLRALVTGDFSHLAETHVAAAHGVTNLPAGGGGAA
jgi:TRAP-type C4-dicarboxylate transport system permease small subunit